MSILLLEAAVFLCVCLPSLLDDKDRVFLYVEEEVGRVLRVAAGAVPHPTGGARVGRRRLGGIEGREVLVARCLLRRSLAVGVLRRWSRRLSLRS